MSEESACPFCGTKPSDLNPQFKLRDIQIRAEAFKEVGEWLEKRQWVLFPSDYKGHLHAISHLEIQSFLEGNLPNGG